MNRMNIDVPSKEHADMLDILWTCDSQEDLDQYLATLTRDQLVTAKTLIELVILAEDDERAIQNNNIAEVNSMIISAKSQKNS